MCDHYCIIWLSMLGDDKGSKAAVEGKSVLLFLVLGWFLIKHSLNFFKYIALKLKYICLKLKYIFFISIDVAM